MPKHFAFVVPAAHGHVNPTLPLVEELTRRGHRVSYATGEELLPKAADCGAEGVALPSKMDPRLLPKKKLTAADLANMLQHFLDDARQCLPVLLSQFERDRPDAICYDGMAFTGRMVAEKLELPEAALVPNFAANEHFSLHETMKPADLGDSAQAFEAFGKGVADLAAQYGVAAPPVGQQAPPAALNLVFIPRRFQIAGETFDRRFRFLGPAIGKREHAGQFEPASPDQPLLYISLGTAFNQRLDFYQMCFEAFGDTQWQVAMSVGEVVDRADLGEIPANFDVRPHFPQPAVLRRATAFLTHCGMNSTMESLYYGVPIIGVPQMPEQEANAGRAEELGFGRKLTDDDLTAESVRKAVDEVSGDAEIRANLTVMQQELRGCGGPSEGADALEQFLS